MPPLETRQACRIPRPILSAADSDRPSEAIFEWSLCPLLSIGNGWLSPALGLQMRLAFAFATVRQWTGSTPALPSASAPASDTERRAIARLSRAQFVRLRLAIRLLFEIHHRPKEVCCATA